VEIWAEVLPLFRESQILIYLKEADLWLKEARFLALKEVTQLLPMHLEVHKFVLIKRLLRHPK
jgi:hypothetical protein